jgi:hypothetical protein
MGQVLDISGEVRWCGKLTREDWKAGVVFTEVATKDQTLLRNWLRVIAVEAER